MSVAVVKVGGSLFDLPDLGRRLAEWIPSLGCETVILVPGGGAAADFVRKLDRERGLGEESSHWLALRAMAHNAAWLAGIVPGTLPVIAHPSDAAAGGWYLLDAYRYCLSDEQEPDHLPHCWSVTGDSVAARVAVTLVDTKPVRPVTALALLKSCRPPDDVWSGGSSYVDPLFVRIIAGHHLRVLLVNFRAAGGPTTTTATTRPAATP